MTNNIHYYIPKPSWIDVTFVLVAPESNIKQVYIPIEKAERTAFLIVKYDLALIFSKIILHNFCLPFLSCFV